MRRNGTSRRFSSREPLYVMRTRDLEIGEHAKRELLAVDSTSSPIDRRRLYGFACLRRYIKSDSVAIGLLPV